MQIIQKGVKTSIKYKLEGGKNLYKNTNIFWKGVKISTKYKPEGGKNKIK